MAEQQHGSFDNALDRPKEFTLNTLLFKYMQLYGNLCLLYTCICVNIVLELLIVIHF